MSVVKEAYTKEIESIYCGETMPSAGSTAVRGGKEAEKIPLHRDEVRSWRGLIFMVLLAIQVGMQVPLKFE